MDVPAGVTQEEGHTGFLYLPSAMLALIFLTRRIQPCLSLVDGEVEFVRDISCACEQQQGTIPSMFAVCNVDYIIDISTNDRISREHFRFPEHRF